MVTLQDGLNFHHAGRLAEAEAIYRAALAAEPQHFHALYCLGVLRGQQGDNAEAALLIAKAIEWDAGVAAAHIHLGHALAGLGRRAEALASYDRAIALEPQAPPGHLARGEVLWKLKRFAEAADAFRQAIALDPACAQGWASLGGVLEDLEHHDEALAACDRAIALNPNQPQAYVNRGAILFAMARITESLASSEKAVALDPTKPVAFYNRGNALFQLGRGGEAIADYDRALSLQPDYYDALRNRGEVLLFLGRFEEALADNERVLSIRPDEGGVASIAHFLRGQLCVWHNRSHQVDDLKRRCRDGQSVLPGMLLSAFDDPALNLLAARKFAGTTKPVDMIAAAPLHERLRIAYLSPDFRDHPVGYQTAELFGHHDRTRFETYGICLCTSPDSEVRQKLRGAFDHFMEVERNSDREIADLLRSLQIDIAVDLAGYTFKSRAKVLSMRPAPIIVNYLGYPGTLGTDYVDYIMADGRVIPPEAEPFYAEKVVRLPDCFMPCDTTVSVGSPPSRSAAGLPESGFVFSSFNTAYKITPEMFDVWMRLLGAVDGSILWLSVGNPTAQRNLRTEAERRGVDPKRLIFAEHVGSRQQHHARIGLADLFLDTLPYNAHSTAADALWAGVPLVTCSGQGFSARVAGSLLSAVGLGEMITTDLAAYEQLARDLARNPARLAAIKERLQRNRAEYPLFDMDRLCRAIESAYSTMWDFHRRGERPRSFAAGVRT